ncbi:SusD/RagB family nutrient-binding outer membrane lipoprotein [Pinibacter soli]|uniref:SusD/RagB family nutrient-binding outer membrane lipoprotein n=1 Tax=Pinibacter soli TaxID=3044211 RepID=A0ABT6RBS5_9BACT|nr:SusD/RagB family nutrient-binding outer membrane lipoprotein [Pinibacter soli]MDI3320022.1 SusD/RagB family nutrient-binding outer membrane lipoprotein [Pinibacter soli]
MKKLLAILSVGVLMVSCKKDIQDLNAEDKKPTDVPAPSLFANAQKNVVDIMTSSSVNFNIFRLVDQYWTETTYTDETNYDLVTRNIPQSYWNTLYRDILNNLKLAKSKIYAQDPATVTAAQLKNQAAITDIMQVYTYSILVNSFGDVPYSQALDVNNLTPKYDDAKTVYYDLLTRIDTSLAALDPTADGFGESDLLYGGDVSKWVAFGNSLKLRLGMTISDYDAVKAKSVVESAAPKVFKSNADNAVFKYLAAPPNTNPIWVDLIQSGRHDFVGAKPIIDTMKTLGDPRLSQYFGTNKDGNYVGGIVGKGNTYSQFSPPSSKITNASFEALVMDYAEVELHLAEAVERGMNVGGTAAQHYNNGVTASITYWGATTADANTYLAKPDVAYGTSKGDYKQKIGYQKWLALYNRGFESWTEIRRLDFPKLAPPAAAQSGFPVRYTYPVQEQNLNKDNYNAASTAIGGDKVETKLFWDKH